MGLDPSGKKQHPWYNSHHHYGDLLATTGPWVGTNKEPAPALSTCHPSKSWMTPSGFPPTSTFSKKPAPNLCCLFLPGESRLLGQVGRLEPACHQKMNLCLFVLFPRKISLISDPNPSGCGLSWCSALHHAMLQQRAQPSTSVLFAGARVRSLDGKYISEILVWIQLLKDIAILGPVS